MSADANADVVQDIQSDVDGGPGRYRFFYANIQRPIAADALTDTQVFATPDTCDYTALLAKHDEQEVRDALTEMFRALTPGMTTTGLVYDPGNFDMILVHSWFGPHLQLFRHSHPS